MKLWSFVMPYVLLFSVNWLTDFQQAKELAKEKNHLIMLNFSGSDWCAPCIKMKKEIFDTQEFGEFANARLVLVRADFPRHKKNQLEPKQKAHNERLAEQYNPSGKFPLTLLLDANGKVIHQWDGYSNMSVESFVKEIQSISHDR